MKKSLFHVFKYSILCLLGGCTYSITMIHTEGTATDVLDDNDTSSLTASIPLTIPLNKMGL